MTSVRSGSLSRLPLLLAGIQFSSDLVALLARSPDVRRAAPALTLTTYVPAGLLIAAYIWLQVALPCHWGPHPQAPSLWGPGCGAVGLLALYALNPGYTYTRVTSNSQILHHSSKCTLLARFRSIGAK